MNLTKMYCYSDEITFSQPDSGLSGLAEYDLTEEHQDAINDIISQIRNKPLESRIIDTGATDMVNEPPHYQAGDIECIDAIRAALTDEEFRGYCKGNMIKYEWRELLKGGLESIKKAIWYGNQMLKHCK